jgi:3-hydroxyacyl-CoA dehydrogenase
LNQLLGNWELLAAGNKSFYTVNDGATNFNIPSKSQTKIQVKMIYYPKQYSRKQKKYEWWWYH